MDNTLHHRFDAKKMQDMLVRLSRWGSDIKVNRSVEERLSKADNIKNREMGHSYLNQTPRLTMILTLTVGNFFLLAWVL